MDYDGTEAYRTPMATGHGSAVTGGNCSNDNEAFGVRYDRVSTSCTSDALTFTAAHEIDGH